MREVMSASMEPSAEMIEPRYVNEGTNSTSSPSMFIGVVIAEEGEIIMALVFVQLIGIPTLDASLLNSQVAGPMCPVLDPAMVTTVNFFHGNVFYMARRAKLAWLLLARR